MMNRRLPADKDVDMLLLIREEESFAGRIREALVFAEAKIERPPAPLTTVVTTMESSYYERPSSPTEGEEISSPAESRRRSSYSRGCKKKRADSDLTVPGSPAYINPPIDKRRMVDDVDSMFSESSFASGQRVKIMFTYADLIAAREGRKTITVRALRPLANLWEKNPKLNKDVMLSEIISEYARRFPDEVREYNQQRKMSSTSRARNKRPKRRGRKPARH